MVVRDVQLFDGDARLVAVQDFLALLVELLGQHLLFLEVVAELTDPGTEGVDLLHLVTQHLFYSFDVVVDVAARLVDLVEQQAFLGSR